LFHFKLKKIPKSPKNWRFSFRKKYQFEFMPAYLR
jgi:hypothetical protein